MLLREGFNEEAINTHMWQEGTGMFHGVMTGVCSLHYTIDTVDPRFIVSTVTHASPAIYHP